MSSQKRILTVVGARPQFIKAAAVSRAILKDPLQRIRESIVHTGQHYDEAMSDIFFKEMKIPEPVANLQVGSGSHADTTGRMMLAIEQQIERITPDVLLVYGDTNSTLAGALAAAKVHVPIVHVEAGLRSFNMQMPEEVNRILTDRVSSLLLCPTHSAIKHLANEGLTQGVHHVGDVMYDVALTFGELAKQRSTILDDLGLTPENFFLATVHRAENTDNPDNLAGIFAALNEIATPDGPVVLPLHPRTRSMIDLHDENPNLKIIEPLSFLDMVRLEMDARLILTDSGGVQKEACFHSVPCVTLRDETEWTETVDAGWNQVVGADTQAILAAASKAQPGKPIHQYGEGNAAEKVVDLINSMPLK